MRKPIPSGSRLSSLVWIALLLLVPSSRGLHGQAALGCAAQASTQGLVSCWSGEGNPNDVTGVNNGSLTGGMGYARGLFDQAFSVAPGGIGSVVANDSPSLQVTDAFTLSAWINPRTLAPDSGSGIVTKVAWTPETGTTGYQFLIYANNTKIASQFNAPGEAWAVNSLTATLASPIPAGKWTHLATTYDGTNLNIYVNGALAGTMFVGSKTVAPSPGGQFRINGYDWANGPFDGMIDEVALYNRALSPNEITKLAYEPVRITGPSTLYPATIGQPYSATVTATGGTGPYVFSVGSGSLPAGLSVSADGVLSGTPTSGGYSNFTLKVTDVWGESGSFAYALPALAPVVTPKVAITSDGHLGDSNNYFHWWVGQYYINTDNGQFYAKGCWNCQWDPILSNPTPRFVSQQNGPELSVFDFTSFTVPFGVTIDVIGSHPGVIATTGDVTVDGRLNVSANGGAGAIPPDGYVGSGIPGSPAPGTAIASGGGGGGGVGNIHCVSYNPWHWDIDTGGGGAGGGSASRGDSGQDGHAVTAGWRDGGDGCQDYRYYLNRGGVGGAPLGSDVLSGGGGGAQGGYTNGWGYGGGGWLYAGGPGGNGGGALMFASSGNVQVTIHGSISADGQSNGYAPGGGSGAGGGGGGGYLLFSVAGAWTNNGAISARGGPNTSCCQPIDPWSHGGYGSGGRVIIAQADSINNQGSVDVSGGSPASGGLFNAGGSAITGTGTLYGLGSAPVIGGTTAAGSNVTSTASTDGTTVTFADVTTGGTTSSVPIDPASAGTLPDGYTPTTIGWDVTTTAAYDSPVTVCFIVPSFTADMFSRLRILHGENGVLVDRTILAPNKPAADYGSSTICASVSSLSPFVLAIAPAPAGHAPSLSYEPGQPVGGFSAIAGAPARLVVHASDPDTNDVVTLAAAGLPDGATFTPQAQGTSVYGTFLWTPRFDQVGIYTFDFVATDGTGLTGQQSVTINVAAPPASVPFAFTPSTNGCLCLPTFGIQDETAIDRVENWYVLSDGTGSLDLTLIAKSVNPVETGSVAATLFDAVNNIIAIIPAIPHPSGYLLGGVDENSSNLVVSATPGAVYRLQVELGPPDAYDAPRAGHYRFEIRGAVEAGAYGSQLRHFESGAATWSFNVGANEPLTVAINSTMLGGPDAPATVQAGLRLIDPQGQVRLAGTENLPYTVDVADAGNVSGQWQLVVDVNGHHDIEKTSGADRGVYVTPMTSGAGQVNVSVTRGGQPANTAIDLQFTNRSTGQSFTNHTGSTVMMLPVGSYTVAAAGPVTPTSAAFDLTCHGTVPLAFELINHAPTVAIPDSPFAMTAGGPPLWLNAVAIDADGDPMLLQWTLVSGGGNLAPNGWSASYSSATPTSAVVQVTATDPYGASSSAQATIVVAAPVHLWHADYNMEWEGEHREGDQFLDGPYPFIYTYRFGILNDPNGPLTRPTITATPGIDAPQFQTPQANPGVSLNPTYPPYVWSSPQLNPMPTGGDSIWASLWSAPQATVVPPIYQLGYDVTREIVEGRRIEGGETVNRTFVLTFTTHDPTLTSLGGSIDFSGVWGNQPAGPPVSASNISCSGPGTVNVMPGQPVFWQVGYAVGSPALPVETTYTLICPLTLTNTSTDPALFTPAIVASGQRTAPPVFTDNSTTYTTPGLTADPPDPFGVVAFTTDTSDTKAELDVHFTRTVHFNGVDAVVDTVAPVTTWMLPPSTTGWYNVPNVWVNLYSMDPVPSSGVKQVTYSLSGAQNQGVTTVIGPNASFGITAAGSTTVTVFAQDNAGNTESPKTFTVNIDRAAPATTATQAPMANTAGWNASVPVTVTLDATDPGGSGVKQITYTVIPPGQPGLPPVTVTGSSASIDLSYEGATTVDYWATDNAGNWEPWKSITVRIDQAPPGTNVSASPGPSWSFNGQNWWYGNVTVNIAGFDNSCGPSLPCSGVSKIWYSTSGAQQADLTSVAGTNAGVLISTEGQTTITYYAEDRAGNLSATSTFVVNRSAPLAPPTLMVAPPLSNASGTFAISGTGVPGAMVSLFDGQTQFAGGIPVDGNGTWSTTRYFIIGSHTLSAKQSLGGQVSGLSSTVTVHHFPSPPGINGPSSVISSTSPATFTLTGGGFYGAGQTPPTGSTITIFEGPAIVGTAVVGSNGQWSTPITLAFGRHSLTASQTLAGETSALSSPFVVNVVDGTPVVYFAPPPAVAAPVIDLGHNLSELAVGAGGGGGFVDPGTNETWTASVNYGDGSPAQSLAILPSSFLPGQEGVTGFFVFDHVYAQSGTYALVVTVTDSYGGRGTGVMMVTVRDLTPPVITLAPAFSVNEGGSVAIPVQVTDNSGAVASVTWTSSAGTVTGNTTAATYSGDDGPATATVTVTATDAAGNTATATTTVTVANVAPRITLVSGPIAPAPINTAVGISASFTDPGTADSHICTFAWGDGTSTTITAAGTGNGTCAATHIYADAGLYSINVTVTDKDGGAVTANLSTPVVIFDPNAGFVTGGGWVDLPTGRVNFGFNAKYIKNQTTLNGQTEFQVQLANINFHSTGYSWLVVYGDNSEIAVWNGTGTVNGAGNYFFQFTVVDGQRDGTGIDKMQMKIWNADGSVYDTGALVPISSGSIVIHEG